MSTWTGAVSTDWNNAGNWIAGGIGIGIPNAGVDAIFSGTPVNNCVMGASRSCRALTFTGYTGTLTVATFGISVHNNVTFQADQSSRIIGTTGILACNASGTITSNSGIWPLDFTINNVGATTTLADDMRVAGSYSVSGGSRIMNGLFSLFVGGNFTSSSTHTGTVNFIMNGSGTYSGAGQCNLEINTSGTIIITGAVQFTRRFIITAVGLITMTAAIVSIIGGTTVDIGGRTIGPLAFVTSLGTTTISTDIYCTSFTSGNSHVINGPGRIYVNGPFGGGSAGGNVTVELIGSGNFSGTISTNLVINTIGTYTFTSNITCNASITHNQGTINPQTFIFQNNVTTLTFNINAPGFNLYDWTLPNIGSNQIMTINSTSGNVLNILRNLNFVNNSPTFAGNIGWTATNFTHTGAGFTCTLQAGNTYTVNGLFTMIGTAGSRATLQSSDAQNVTVSIPALSDQMTLVTGTIPAPAPGYVLGSRAFTSALPAVLSNLFPDRPTILSGPIGSVYTLTEPIDATNVPSSLLLQVGKKAIFRVTNNGTSSTNVLYAQTRDIDSDGGITILAGQSFADNTATPNLFRTLNWGPLIAPSGSVYYTFVN